MLIKKFCMKNILLGSGVVIALMGCGATDNLTSEMSELSFDKDGYEIEPVEDYESSDHNRIRYHFFSEETINQWLKITAVDEIITTDFYIEQGLVTEIRLSY